MAPAKPRVLFVVDVEEWAYGDRARRWQRLVADQFAVDILAIKALPSGNVAEQLAPFVPVVHELLAIAEAGDADAADVGPLLARVRMLRERGQVPAPVFDHASYDGVVVFYHKALRDTRLFGTPLPPDKIAVCINNEKWVPDGARATAELYFSEVAIAVGCNQFIVDQLTPVHPRVMRASQVVDPEVFFTDRDNIVRPTRVGPEFVVGWSGNFQQPIKNVDQVKEACQRAGVKLLISKNRSRDELNRWYNDLVDCVVCASAAEGGPSMILEAGACSRPVVTTPVGLAREIVRDGDTGLVFPVGDLDALAQHLRMLSVDLALRARLATALHSEVTARWTYAARAHEIRDVLRALTTPRRSG